MSEARIAALERRVSTLETQNRNLRLRLEQMLSRKGGHVEGQVHLDGWIQFEEQASISTPDPDLSRIGLLESGGVLQVVAVFPSGTIRVMAQE